MWRPRNLIAAIMLFMIEIADSLYKTTTTFEGTQIRPFQKHRDVDNSTPKCELSLR